MRKGLHIIGSLAWGFGLGHMVTNILKGQWFDAAVMLALLIIIAHHWIQGLGRDVAIKP